MSTDAGSLAEDLERLSAEVYALAQGRKGNVTELLTLLRLLDALHREICDTLFQEALPNNRQALYSLLRDIEATGGWPHISRIKLRDLLLRLEAQEPLSDAPVQGKN